MQLQKLFYSVQQKKLHGIKPNFIGDVRYITVPYALSLNIL